MLEQNDWISGSSDSSDSENARPADAGAELQRATLVELLEKRAAYRAAERHGGREHPYQLALVRELGKRIGVRCHRVECALRPGKICGLAFHRFIVSKQGTSFANVQRWQRAAIEQAVATSTKLRPFRLAFDIDRHAGFEHWAYLAQCSGDASAHGIHITTIRLPRAPGRVSPARQTKQLGVDATLESPARRALAPLAASNSIPVLVTSERKRVPRARPSQAAEESANIAVRLLRLTSLLPAQ